MIVLFVMSAVGLAIIASLMLILIHFADELTTRGVCVAVFLAWVFLVGCLFVGAAWEDARLENDSGTIPPLEIKR